MWSLFEDLLFQNRTVHLPTHSSMTRTIGQSSSMAQSMCVCVCVCVCMCVCVCSYLFICDISFTIGELQQASGYVTILLYQKTVLNVTNHGPLHLCSYKYCVSWSRWILSLVLSCGALPYPLFRLQFSYDMIVSGDVVHDCRFILLSKRSFTFCSCVDFPAHYFCVLSMFF